MTPLNTREPSEGQARAFNLIGDCRANATLYTEREVDFLKSIGATLSRGDEPTVAQLAWLEKLAQRERVDFDALNRAALPVLISLCRRWLSDGRQQGHEYVARNPLRSDTNPGSFRINLTTGRWADFALDDARGGDPVSLAAYLFHNGDQVAAGLGLKRMLAS